MDLKLSNYSTTAAMNGSIASANNATLATVAANYGLKTVVDQHSLDIAARITPLEVDTKVANALLGAVTAAALASELASRDASISGLQASKADASALTAYALQSAVDTSSVVDSKIAAALLGAVTTAALDAALLGKADASALASLLSTVDGLDTPLEVDTKIANALLGLATEAFVAAQLHPDAEEGPGHEGGAQGRAVERPLRAGGRGLQRAAPRDGARRARGRGSSGSSKTTPTSSSTTRTSPSGEGGGGRGRLPSADERGEELQPSVRRRAAAGGRGLHDRPQHGGPRDPAEAGAAGAGQRQRGGPADETGQAGGCEAAGRLPGASEAQDPRLV